MVSREARAQPYGYLVIGEPRHYVLSMAKRHQRDTSPPPCYALVVPGLEAITAEEITEYGGSVRKTNRGLVVFRVAEITPDLLTLRTAEDVFLFAWGTDTLTHRAVDLKSIRAWTANDADWSTLLRYHHLVRPIRKGRPSYRLVTQMVGKHVYRRADAGEALAKGLAGKFPKGWQQVADNAHVEIWLTIRGPVAVCGMRLSDKSMRHRTYKVEHLPASLRPTVAAAMVRLADAPPHSVVLDPTCGAGTILAEQILRSRDLHQGHVATWGGDIDTNTIRAARENLKHVGPALLARWDVARLPLPDQSVDRIICNPPFGKQLSSPEQIRPLYRALTREGDRVLKPGGRAVLLVSDIDELRDAAMAVGWMSRRQLTIEVLGQRAVLVVWQKRGGTATL